MKDSSDHNSFNDLYVESIRKTRELIILILQKHSSKWHYYISLNLYWGFQRINDASNSCASIFESHLISCWNLLAIQAILISYWFGRKYQINSNDDIIMRIGALTADLGSFCSSNLIILARWHSGIPNHIGKSRLGTD